MLRFLPLVSELTTQNISSSNNVTGGGVDYDSGPYTVTFTAGVTRVPFDVSIDNDNELENPEQFRLDIVAGSLPTNVNVGTPNSATVTINDDESKF